MTTLAYTGFLLRADTLNPQALIEAFKALCTSAFGVEKVTYSTDITPNYSALIPNGIDDGSEIMLMAQPGFNRIVLRSWGPVQGKSIHELLQALQPLCAFLDLSNAQGCCIVDNNDPENEDEPTHLALPEGWGKATIAPYVPFQN